MPKTEVPDQFLLRLDESSFRNFAKLRSGAGGLRVFVPYTSGDLTKASLTAVNKLTIDLGARVTLFAVRVVPFPLPLDRPDVAPKFLERKLASIATEIDMPVDIRVVFVRDLEVGLQQVLMDSSLVVVATHKRWVPSGEVKLARLLSRLGHSVALVQV